MQPLLSLPPLSVPYPSLPFQSLALGSWCQFCNLQNKTFCFLYSVTSLEESMPITQASGAGPQLASLYLSPTPRPKPQPFTPSSWEGRGLSCLCPDPALGSEQEETPFRSQEGAGPRTGEAGGRAEKMGLRGGGEATCTLSLSSSSCLPHSQGKPGEQHSLCLRTSEWQPEAAGERAYHCPHPGSLAFILHCPVPLQPTARPNAAPWCPLGPMTG